MPVGLSTGGAMPPMEMMTMPSGGHARSGPRPDPKSERSERRGFKLTELPSTGFDGDVPEWPILPAASEAELEYWQRAWRTPQACVWSLPEHASWIIPDVARWVRLAVRCDEPDAPATLLARLAPAADNIGMSTAGMSRLGWSVKADEVAEKRAEKDEGTAREGAPKRERRLRAAK